MLESYFEEVKRKRRFKNLFWLLVLIFATGLYFFFKGYYISLNIDWKNWKNIFSQDKSVLNDTGSEIASINSFGIIYIKTNPTDATVELYEQNEPKKYSNGEKLFTNYGDYTLKIHKNNFVSGEMDFSINNEINFYTDTVMMLKNPEYKIFPSLENKNIFALGNNSWITQEKNIFTLYTDNFLTGTIIHTGSELKHIGEGNFLSGSTLMKYNTLAGEWITNKNPIVQNFVATCPNLAYQSAFLHCPDTKTAMMETGKSFTGVVAYGKNFLKQENSLILGDFTKDQTEKFSLTGSTEIGEIFIKIDENWYTEQNGNLKTIDKKISETQKFGENFGKIIFADTLNGIHFLISEKNEEKFLTIINPHGQHKIRTIDFPNIEIKDTRIYEKNGNFFIKNTSNLHFVYREGKNVHWIIDGKILAIGENFAIYEEKNSGKIMIADWSEKKS